MEHYCWADKKVESPSHAQLVLNNATWATDLEEVSVVTLMVGSKINTLKKTQRTPNIFWSLQRGVLRTVSPPRESGAGWLGFKPGLHHFWAMCHWGSHLPLTLSFFVCQMGIMTVRSTQGCVGVNQLTFIKLSKQCLVHSKSSINSYN